MVTELRQIMHESPVLSTEFSESAQKGDVKAIQLSKDPHSAGDFNDANKSRAVEVHGDLLSNKREVSRYEATWVLGHELKHSLNMDTRQADYKELDASLRLAMQGNTPHDITAIAQKFLEGRKVDEAKSEIAGYNATVSALNHNYPNHGEGATLRQIYDANRERASEFLEVKTIDGQPVVTPKPGITLNKDHSASETPENIQAVGKSFFDRKPDLKHDEGLGRSGDSDYRNFYGAYVVSRAAQLNRFYQPGEQQSPEPSLRLDMAKLGLDRKQLMDNGVDLGGNQRPFTFIDMSHGRPSFVELVHTGSPGQQSPLAPRLDDPAHPGNDLYQQAYGKLSDLDGQMGRASDQRTANLAGAATVAALGAGITRIDHVLPDINNGSTMFVAQNTSPLKTIAEVPTMRGMNTSLEQSSAQYQQVAQQQAQAQAQQQTQQQTQAQAQAQDMTRQQAQPTMQIQMKPPGP